MTVEQAIGESLAGTEGNIAVVESRWSKAFKLVGKLAKITGIMASFVGAITTGLKLFRDIKNGEEPAVIAFEVIEVWCTISFLGLCSALRLSFTKEYL